MKTEDLKLDVRARFYGGTYIARCNGKTASSTSCEAGAVEVVAAKAIKAIAELYSDPAIAERPRVFKHCGGGVWTVTVQASVPSDLTNDRKEQHASDEGRDAGTGAIGAHP